MLVVHYLEVSTSKFSRTVILNVGSDTGSSFLGELHVGSRVGKRCPMELVEEGALGCINNVRLLLVFLIG
jgi:hypothetical protein